ncbi:MAG: DUF2400 domain-containing protein [Thermoplasmata archaeon]|nr:DUF2400 domain-containing protein [Thermoplasmata archaeon]
MRIHRPTPELPQHLEALYRDFPFERSLAEDPISSIRPFTHDTRSAEVLGILAATLAIGNTTAIRGSLARLMALTAGAPEQWLLETPRGARARALRPFRHRWIRGDQVEYLARVLAEYYSSHETLEDAFLEGYLRGGFPGGLDSLVRVLRGDGSRNRNGPPPAGYLHLFPSPLGTPRSPCKRMTLFVRWMVRERYPDLGYWRRVPTGDLRVPLDLHVHWIAYNLGLTTRRTRSWAAVEEVSEALRRIDPIDPIKFDFVLCHTGISGDCPKRRDISVCGPCSVRPDCRMWRGRGVAA